MKIQWLKFSNSPGCLRGYLFVQKESVWMSRSKHPWSPPVVSTGYSFTVNFPGFDPAALAEVREGGLLAMYPMNPLVVVTSSFDFVDLASSKLIQHVLTNNHQEFLHGFCKSVTLKTTVSWHWFRRCHGKLGSFFVLISVNKRVLDHQAPAWDKNVGLAATSETTIIHLFLLKVIFYVWPYKKAF